MIWPQTECTKIFCSGPHSILHHHCVSVCVSESALPSSHLKYLNKAVRLQIYTNYNWQDTGVELFTTQLALGIHDTVMHQLFTTQLALGIHDTVMHTTVHDTVMHQLFTTQLALVIHDTVMHMTVHNTVMHQLFTTQLCTNCMFTTQLCTGCSRHSAVHDTVVT